MNAASKQQLIEMLTDVAKKLRARPGELEKEYDERGITGSERAGRMWGALEAACDFAGIEILALVDTFLKPQRRPRGRK